MHDNCQHCAAPKVPTAKRYKCGSNKRERSQKCIKRETALQHALAQLYEDEQILLKQNPHTPDNYPL